MKKIASRLAWILMLLFSGYAQAQTYFSTHLCQSEQYDCVKITKRDTWSSLWPDPYQRDLVQRLNRMNTPLRTHMLIALPHKQQMTAMDFSPFSGNIAPPYSKLIVVDLTALA